MRHRYVLTILTLAAVISCSQSEPIPDPAIVVEGWIEEGRPPVVMLHQALSKGDDLTDMEEAMTRKVINWGKVTLSDGENSVVLTGRKDTSLVPPYKYTTYKMIPEAGKRYSIKVEYSGLELDASTTLLPAVAIDSVHVNQVSDIQSTIEIFWTDSPASEDWYCIFFRPSERSQWINACLSVSDDSKARPDGVMSCMVIPRKSIKYGNLTTSDSDYACFASGQDIDIRLAHIDREAYLFWKSFSDITGAGFYSPVSADLATNIRGGLGYFTGIGAYDMTVNL